MGAEGVDKEWVDFWEGVDLLRDSLVLGGG